MKAHFVTPEGEFDAHIHIPGEHNVYNAMAAAAVGLQLGLTIAEIKSGIEKAETIAGRTNFIKTHGMTVIDDCSGCIFLCKLSCGKKCMDMILSNCFAYLMVQLFLIASKLTHVA